MRVIVDRRQIEICRKPGHDRTQQGFAARSGEGAKSVLADANFVLGSRQDHSIRSGLGGGRRQSHKSGAEKNRADTTLNSELHRALSLQNTPSNLVPFPARGKLTSKYTSLASIL